MFLDYDGTLAPIVPHPEDARMADGTRLALERLACNSKYTIALVSGRGLADLETRVGIPGIVYAGNHGLEIRGCGLRFSIGGVDVLRQVVQELRAGVRAIAGAEVEDKGLTASVHFRRVAPGDWPAVERIVRGTAPSGIAIHEGKMVFEIRPAVSWNKGSAVRWMVEQLDLEGALLAYFGDDRTDEDAFAVLPEGVTVRVGEGESLARWRMRDVEQVETFLRALTGD